MMGTMEGKDPPPTRKKQKENDMSTTAKVEGRTVKIGDWVGFKSDIEQGGQIIAITRDTTGYTLHLENKNGFDGDYIGGDTITHQDARDCWVEG